MMDELAKRFADLAEKYGPNVVDAAKAATRIEAYSCLMGATFGITISIVLLIGGMVAWKKFDNDEDKFPYAILSGLLFFFGITGISLGIWSWIDPWTWVAINHPEIWLAKKAFHL